MSLGSIPIARVVDQIGALLAIGIAGMRLALVVGSVMILSTNYRRI